MVDNVDIHTYIISYNMIVCVYIYYTCHINVYICIFKQTWETRRPLKTEASDHPVETTAHHGTAARLKIHCHTGILQGFSINGWCILWKILL